MTRLFLIVFILFITSIFSLANAALLTLDEKLNDFNTLNASIDSGYGPLLYKQQNKILDLSHLRAEYSAKIKNSKTNEEFYYLMVQYVAAYHDGHFGLSVPTDYAAYLPIPTELVDGKILISEINRDQLSKDKFPPEKGDEVLTVDGRPVMDVVADLQTYVGSGYSLTEQRIASWMVFSRPGNRMPVPEGKVKFSVRRGTSQIIENYEFDWLHKGEKLVEVLEPKSNLMRVLNKPFVRPYDDLSIKMFNINDPNPSLDRKYMCSGSTRIDIPKDATIIMKTPIVAYYYPTAKGNIGYLRIPEYMAFNQSYQSEFELRFKQYEFAVSVLEKNTVGLIIDQDHNCGGSVTFLESLLGLFMSESYAPMQFELRANKEEYLGLASALKTMNENTLEYFDVKALVELLKNSWLKGDYLTPKTSITGVKTLYPNQVHYTKPIIVLIDELAGSGGDAFPSMMKGMGRAKLLGTRTSGLGGHVTELPNLPNSQLAIRMTKSLFYRPDGVAVENNGAEPDYQYTHSRDDFMFGYREYRKFYTDKMLELLN